MARHFLRKRRKRVDDESDTNALNSSAPSPKRLRSQTQNVPEAPAVAPRANAYPTRARCLTKQQAQDERDSELHPEPSSVPPTRAPDPAEKRTQHECVLQPRQEPLNSHPTRAPGPTEQRTQDQRAPESHPEPSNAHLNQAPGPVEKHEQKECERDSEPHQEPPPNAYPAWDRGSAEKQAQNGDIPELHQEPSNANLTRATSPAEKRAQSEGIPEPHQEPTNSFPTHAIKLHEEQEESDEFSLHFWGVPDIVQRNYRRLKVERLFQWQLDCLKHEGARPFREAANLVYTAPTGCGKTFVCELLMQKFAFASGPSRLALVVVPYLSIVVEKTNYLKKVFRGSSVLVQGLFRGSKSLSPSTSICVCTIERANGFVNRMIEEQTLHRIGFLMVDEVHMIGDDRGHHIEGLLSKIVFYNASHHDHHHGRIQIVALSATLPNLNVFGRWLNAVVFEHLKRDIELHHFAVIGNEVIDSALRRQRVLKCRSTYGVAGELCSEVVGDRECVIVFCASKKACRDCSLALAKSLATATVVDNSQRAARIELLSRLRALPCGLDRALAESIPAGVAQHHAGLLLEERELIEDAFRARIVLVVAATSTLSAGVNLPTRRVIMLVRGLRPQLSIVQYHQMAGRAGRANSGAGDSFLLVDAGKQALAQQFLGASLPSAQSTLTLERHGLASLMLDGIASSLCSNREALTRLVCSTLLRHALCTSVYDAASDPDSGLWRSALAAQQLLQDNEFIEWRDTTVVASKLGLAAFASGLMPNDALIVFSSLSQTLDYIRLDDDLHVVYLVTPVNLSLYPSWEHFLAWFQRAAPPALQIAHTLGIEENVLQLQASPGASRLRPQQRQKYTRFWGAVLLQQLLQEREPARVSASLGCSRGDLQNLLALGSTFAGMVTAFCERLRWFSLHVLCGGVAERLSENAPQHMLPLLALPGMDFRTANKLYREGVTSIASIASSEPLRLARIILDARPFEAAVIDPEQKTKRLHTLCDGARELISAASRHLQKQQQQRQAAVCLGARGEVGPLPPLLTVLQCVDASADVDTFLEFVDAWKQQSRYALVVRFDDNDHVIGGAELSAGSAICAAVCWQDSPVYLLTFRSSPLDVELLWRHLTSQLGRREQSKCICGVSSVVRRLRQLGAVVAPPVEDPLVAVGMAGLAVESLEGVVEQLFPRSILDVDVAIDNCAAIRCYNTWRSMYKLRRMLGPQRDNLDTEMRLALLQAEMELVDVAIDSSASKFYEFYTFVSQDTLELRQWLSALGTKQLPRDLPKLPKALWLPVSRRSVHEELLESGWGNLVDAFCSDSSNRCRRVLVDADHPVVGVLVDVLDAQRMRDWFTSHDSATLADFWTNTGKTLHVRVEIHAGKLGGEHVLFPCDKVWRLDAFRDISQADRAKELCIKPRLCLAPASDKHVLIAADYQHLQARVLAHLSCDQMLLEVMNGSSDVLRSIAARLLQVTAADVSPEQCRLVQSVLLSFTDGIGTPVLAKRLGMSLLDADVLRNEFLTTYSGVQCFIDATRSACRRDGFVRSLAGRRRQIPCIHSSTPHERAQAERQAVSAVCQDSAADVMNGAMLQLHDALANLSKAHRHGIDGSSACGRIFLRVHHELVVEVRRDCSNEVVSLIRNVMMGYGVVAHLSVKLDVSISIGLCECRELFLALRKTPFVDLAIMSNKWLEL